MQTFLHRISILIFLLFFNAYLTQAQWNFDPRVNQKVSSSNLAQNAGAIVDDGGGNFIVAWVQVNGTDDDIFIQKYNASGVAMWNPGGVAVCTATSFQNTLSMIGDGAGGAVITWQDQRGGAFFDVYAQRFNSAGTAQWGVNGVVVCDAVNSQLKPRITNSAADWIIVWEDGRAGAGDVNIYAQKINGSGLLQWGASNTGGSAICTAAGNQSLPQIAPSISNGAIITWQDPRIANIDIYAQLVDENGTVIWTTNGVNVCNGATQTQGAPVIITNASGEAMIVWEDQRAGAGVFDVYAQYVRTDGSLQYTPLTGKPICTATGNQQKPVMDISGTDLVLAWQDNRSGNFDIYATKINPSNGNEIWVGGVPVCTLANSQLLPTIAPDGLGGAVIAWGDNRSGTGDIFAQGLDVNGMGKWTPGGVPVANAVNGQLGPQAVRVAGGGAVMVWNDNRSGTNNIYINLVNQDGNLPVFGATPTSGSTGTIITLNGSNFEGVGPDSIWLNGASVGSFTSNCPSPCNSFYFTVPAMAPGNYPVEIFNRTGKNILPVNFTVLAGGNTITTNPVSGSPFCAGTSLSVGFSSTGTFNAGNNYIAQLSDAGGSFATPVPIGTYPSTGNGGSVSVTIPPGTPSGIGYRIRIVSDNPAIDGTDNGTDFEIVGQVIAPTISTGPSDVCEGAISISYISTTVVNASSYLWTVDPLFNIGTGQGTTNLTVNFPAAGSGNICVRAINSCFNSTVKLNIL